jgi:hypothetical protein
VLLAQASTHLWPGRHEDVGSLLDEALAEAQHDEMPSLELEVLGLMAFVESYWWRPNRHRRDLPQASRHPPARSRTARSRTRADLRTPLIPMR